LLAYLRTAIALLAAGGTLVKLFSDEQAMVKLGIILLTLGGVVILVGIGRFAGMQKALSQTYKKLDE
jgi:uncharacterized membrane protein YidH (DUF202 family)